MKDILRRLSCLLPIVAVLAACAGAADPAATPRSTTSLVGAPAPEFSLRDTGGRTVSLEYYRGQRHIVLVFYIGHT